MKSHTEYFTFETKKKRELVHLTPQLGEVLARSGVAEGFMLVSAMHITAGVFVNDDEPGLHQDIWKWLEGLAPFRADYKHHDTGEDNGDAHLKSMLVHHEVIVPITKGRLDLGPGQRVFYAEFDGQRRKRLVVKVLGE
jgi:secondary thiamine-phosphate synthase enzyme